MKNFRAMAHAGARGRARVMLMWASISGGKSMKISERKLRIAQQVTDVQASARGRAENRLRVGLTQYGRPDYIRMSIGNLNA